MSPHWLWIISNANNCVISKNEYLFTMTDESFCLEEEEEEEEDEKDSVGVPGQGSLTHNPQQWFIAQC